MHHPNQPSFCNANDDGRTHFPSAPLAALRAQIFHVIVGMYTIYSGVITTADSIPAGLLWVYYTNPGVRLIAPPTLVVGCARDGAIVGVPKSPSLKPGLD